MPDDALSRDDAEARLWQALDDTRIGMLGLPGDHMQPMTGFRDEADGAVWFYTRDETDLARRAAVDPQRAMFCLISKDRELYACVAGRLSLSRDRERIGRFWNPVVAAWYPEGKDDPHLVLLRLEPEDAQLWLSTKGPVRFAWEVARANLTGDRPDMGERAEIRFH